MGLQINNNVAAFNSYRNLSVNQGQMEKSLEKLSSGFRINRAADDAAGLAISEGLRSQVGGLKQATRNAQDGVSLVQTAEGTLTEVHSMLQRMNELAVQHNSGVQNTDSQLALSNEFSALQTEIGRVTTAANFNGVALFGTGSVNFQVGDATTDVVAVNLAAVPTSIASAAITDNGSVKTAITDISSARAALGATQNTFESTIRSLNVAVENLTASESRIRDTDMALEMVNFTKNQILTQAGTAMLSQANQAPQGVLQLLR